MIRDFANAVAQVPEGAVQVYLRVRRGGSRHRLTTIESVYLEASDVTSDRIVRELHGVRERFPGDRLWADAFVKGENAPYVNAIELPRTLEARPSQLPAEIVQAASADALSVLVGGLVTLSLHFRDVADRHLDTIDHLGDQLRESERELGRLRARVAASSAITSSDVDPEDEDGASSSALDKLTDVVASAWTKVQQAQQAASDPIAAVKSALRSMTPKERADRIATFLSDPEVQGYLGPEDDPADVQPSDEG